MRRFFAVAAGVWQTLLYHSPVWAQAAASEADAPAEKDYVLCYFLVGLCVALGIIVIVRPTNRRKEVKVEE